MSSPDQRLSSVQVIELRAQCDEMSEYLREVNAMMQLIDAHFFEQHTASLIWDYFIGMDTLLKLAVERQESLLSNLLQLLKATGDPF